jgi:hypothetical protein
MNQNGRPRGETFRFCHTCQKSNCNKCPKEDSPNYTSKKIKYLPNDLKYRYVRTKIPDNAMIPNRQRTRAYKKIVKYIKSKDLKTTGKRTRYTSHNTNIINVFKAKKKVNNSIECPICLTQKGNFDTLGCGHSLCKDCRVNILNTPSLNDKCPLCRKNMFCENYKNYILVKKSPCGRQVTGSKGKSYTLIESRLLDESESESESYDSDDSYDGLSYDSYDSFGYDSDD